MKVLVFPKSQNPYQELLYAPLRDQGVTITYLIPLTGSHILGLIFLIPQLILYKINGYNIFHIHWFYTFQLTVSNLLFQNIITRVFFTFYFIIFILTIKVLNFKLIWTIHNLSQHTNHFILEKRIVAFVGKTSNILIIHSPSIQKNLGKMGINESKIHIMQMGNYNIYPNTISQNVARSILKINKKSFVITYFGKIEKYKGVMELIDAFQQLELSDSILIIAGECVNNQLKKALLDKINNTVSIKHYIRFIPNNDIQLYIQAANITICPYLKVTTSSTAYLYLAFNKPLIYPLLGNLIDLPDNIGFPYNPYEKDSLKKCILLAYNKNSNLIKMNESINKFKESISWYASAQSLLSIYNLL